METLLDSFRVVHPYLFLLGTVLHYVLIGIIVACATYLQASYISNICDGLSIMKRFDFEKYTLYFLIPLNLLCLVICQFLQGDALNWTVLTCIVISFASIYLLRDFRYFQFQESNYKVIRIY